MAENEILLPLLNGVEIEAALTITLPKDVTIDEDDNVRWLAKQFIKAGLDVVVDEPGNKTDYRTWKLTTDSGVEAPAPEDGSDYTDTEAVELISPPRPVFNTSSVPWDQPVFEELKQYVTTLRRDRNSPSTYRCEATDTCGLHIHFGFDKGQPIPFDVCMCLALLVVLYEPVINTLHHWQRTPIPDTQAATYARSNRIGFQQDKHACHGMVEWQEVKRRIFATRNLGPKKYEALASLMGACEPRDGTYQPLELAPETPPSPTSSSQTAETSSVFDGSRTSTPPTTMSWKQEREKYKRDKFLQNYDPPRPGESSTLKPHNPSWDKPDSGTGDWCNLYPRGDKYKIVRWENLNRSNTGPKTIEFRQPAGTLDVNEIAFTMQFYTALIRAAEKLAKKLPPQKEEHEEQMSPSVPAFPLELEEEGEGKEPTLQGLLDLLELPLQMQLIWRCRNILEELRFWRHRAEFYYEVRYTCEACANEARQDQPLGWGDETS